MDQGVETRVAEGRVVDGEHDRQVLGQLLQAGDIFLDVLWGTVVVVQDGEDAVNEVVVCEAKAVVDGEGKMDEVVQQQMQSSLDQLAQCLCRLVPAGVWSIGQIRLQQLLALTCAELASVGGDIAAQDGSRVRMPDWRDHYD